MRCGCRECGTFMVNSENECVCPACLEKCNDCLGGGRKGNIVIKDGWSLPEHIRKAYDEDFTCK